MRSLARAAVVRVNRKLDSLRRRVFALFIIMLLVPSAVSVGLAVNFGQRQSEQARLQAEQYAVFAANHQAQLLGDVREALLSLGVALARGPAAQCEARLADAITRYPQLAEVLLVDSGGSVACASGPHALSVSVASQSWFRDVSAKSGFVIGDNLDAHQPMPSTIAAAQAIDGGNRGFSGAIAAAVRIDWLRIDDVLHLPADSTAEVFDSAGNAVFRTPSVGLGGWAPAGVVTQDMPRVFGARDGTGRWRAFGSAGLGGTGIRVLIGVPATAGPGGVTVGPMIGIVALMLLWLLILVAAWISIDRWVFRWVRRLNRAALDFSRGEAVLLDLDRAPVELRQLGETFATMARHARARETELRGSLMQQEWLVRETHHRVKNNLQIVASLVNLRAKALRSVDARRAFADIQMPIRALALVHRHLYDSEDERTVDVRPIIAELCLLFRDASEIGPAEVNMTSDLERLPLNADRAVPVILLVTEAVSRALHRAKRADGAVGVVSVDLQGDGDRIAVLRVAEGLSAASSAAAAPTESAAERLTNSLMGGLVRQIGGTIAFPGDGVVLRFRMDAVVPQLHSGDDGQTA